MAILTDRPSTGFAAQTVYEHLSFTPKDTVCGNLVLVNRQHPIKNDPPSHDLIDINNQQHDLLVPHQGSFVNLLSHLAHPVEEVPLQKQAATMLFSLIKKSGSAGTLTAVSGYRSYQEQLTVWNDTVSKEGASLRKNMWPILAVVSTRPVLPLTLPAPPLPSTISALICQEPAPFPLFAVLPRNLVLFSVTRKGRKRLHK